MAERVPEIEREWEAIGAEALLVRRLWRLVAFDLERGCEHTRAWLGSPAAHQWAALTAGGTIAPEQFSAWLLARHWAVLPDAAPDHTGGYGRTLRLSGVLPPGRRRAKPFLASSADDADMRSHP